MPVIANPPASPYPLVSTIMNVARARVNDMSNGAAGDLLADDTPYAPVLLNAAWQWLLAKWTQGGGEPFKREVVIAGFPARASNDPAQPGFLGQMQSSDGVNFYQSNYLLPADMIQPLSVWRRTSSPTGPLLLMELAKDGLPRWLNCNVFDWRDAGGMYLFGDTQPQDLLIRYQAQWPDLSLTDPLAQAAIVRCENCLAARIAFEFASMRGGAQAAAMQALADEEFGVILQRTVKREQRKNLRRRAYGFRAGSAERVGGGGVWPVGTGVGGGWE